MRHLEEPLASIKRDSSTRAVRISEYWHCRQLSRRVIDAITRELERQMHEGRASVNHYFQSYFPLCAELRALFARPLGTTAAESSRMTPLKA
jgi:hypothetical protein